MAEKHAPRHTARFGARYGVSVKKRFETFEVKQRVKHACPKCGFQKVQRISTGIFHCKKCHAKYAGGAFYPQTLSGGIIAKMVAQRTFNPQLIEVLSEETPSLPALESDEWSDEEKIAKLTQTESTPKRKRRKAETNDSEAMESESIQSENEDEKTAE